MINDQPPPPHDEEMTDEMSENFETKQFQNAEIIKTPNTLKKKVGSGGFDQATLLKAEKTIAENKIDFTPTAQEFINLMSDTIGQAQAALIVGERAVESLIYPAMQLKAQGAMFQYPLITDIAESLVNFLETLHSVNQDVLDIVAAHKKTISIIIQKQMKSSDTPEAIALKNELNKACERYKKTYNQ
jgi:hypothetical protein